MTAVYSAPGWRRLVVALGYAVVVASLVWVMEASTGQPSTPTARAPATTTSAVVVQIESTYPVAHWTVLVDGKSVTGAVAATTWSGSVTGREMLVQAERADAADLSAGALRLHIGTRTQLAWGEGTVSVQGSLP